MKKSILTVMSILMLCALTFAGNVPTAVQKAFEQKFPGATNIKWDKENAHEYEASFDLNSEKYSANFSDQGTWLETESSITFNLLPDKVQSTFNTSNKDATVKAVAKIETSQGVTKYEIEYKQGVKTIETLYNEDGTVIKN